MDAIAKVYAKAIIAGDKSIDDVPARLRERVEYWIQELSPDQPEPNVEEYEKRMKNNYGYF